MKAYRKNVVCSYCKIGSCDEINKTGLQITKADPGEMGKLVTTFIKNDDQVRHIVADKNRLSINDRKSILIQKIIKEITDLTYFSTEPLVINFSVYLSQKLDYDYTYLAHLFSDLLGITIEKFFIRQKIERVKELLVYNYTLTEISFLMHYCSVAHLSSQFKKVTGLTPSCFKRTSQNKSHLKIVSKNLMSINSKIKLPVSGGF
jgi:AraC-like DNA-binding protein